MKNENRKEQEPETKKSKTKPELPMDDPNYHYRVLSTESETADRVGHHRELGYGVAKHTNRTIVMACKREDHEKRQAQARSRADRLRTSQEPTSREMVHDETTIEVTRGVPGED